MIISKASVVGSPSRFGAWLRHLAAALAVVAFASETASAQFYTFKGVTNNNSNDTSIAQSQFRLQVASAGSGTSFTFTTLGGQPASITDVYFYDPNQVLGTVTSTNPTILNSSGVEFTRDANPAQLPGLNPNLTVLFSADSQTPALGVDQVGESLKITFASVSSQTVINALNAGTLTVGIHVQAFASGGSESLITVPEPTSIAMLGISSLAGLGYAWQRRRRVVD